jgi:hypothetical protein
MQNDVKFQWKSNDPNAASNLEVPFQSIKGEGENVIHSCYVLSAKEIRHTVQ